MQSKAHFRTANTRNWNAERTFNLCIMYYYMSRLCSREHVCVVAWWTIKVAHCSSIAYLAKGNHVQNGTDDIYVVRDTKPPASGTFWSNLAQANHMQNAKFDQILPLKRQQIKQCFYLSLFFFFFFFKFKLYIFLLQLRSCFFFFFEFSCSFCLVIFLLMVHSPDFFPRKLKYFSLRVRLFCMALVEQLGDDSWYVVCAACCHMALVFAVMHLYNIF